MGFPIGESHFLLPTTSGIIFPFTTSFGKGCRPLCARDSTTKNTSSCKPPTSESASRNSAANSIWNSEASSSTTTTPRACCPALSRTPSSACWKVWWTMWKSSSPSTPTISKKARPAAISASRMTKTYCDSSTCSVPAASSSAP